jgi:hypothetical protein
MFEEKPFARSLIGPGSRGRSLAEGVDGLPDHPNKFDIIFLQAMSTKNKSRYGL